MYVILYLYSKIIKKSVMCTQKVRFCIKDYKSCEFYISIIFL